MIIVEGLQDEVPALQSLPERMLVLRDAQIAGGTVDTASEIGINTTRTVNGVVNPTITMVPGATELWRVGNNSANLYYRLVLDGHQLHLVGRDGNHLNRMLTLDEVLLPPGGAGRVAGPAIPVRARPFQPAHARRADWRGGGQL